MGIVARIIPKSRGTYDITKTYYELDYVRFANCTWIAKKQSTGNVPPTPPAVDNEYWTLLAQDGVYTGQFPEWNDVKSKPFTEVNTDDFDVDVNGKLSIVQKLVKWVDILSKPFSTLSETFTAYGGELDLKIDNNTIQRDEDGRLFANIASSGFDIHGLRDEKVISTTDELPFYDASADGTRKTTWANLVSRLASFFSRIYNSESEVITSTTLKDTIEEVNSNNSAGQLAGALAVKTIFDSIAPKPTNVPAFSTSKVYDVGAVVDKNGEVYYCVVPITVEGAWDETKWRKWGEAERIKFGIDSNGNYGFVKVGADSVTPFSSGSSKSFAYVLGSGSRTYDIKSVCDDIRIEHKVEIDYTTLTNANFCVSSGGGGASANGESPYDSGSLNATLYMNGSATCSSASWSYNKSSGILSVGNGYISVNATGKCGNAQKTISGGGGVGAGTAIMFIGLNQ